MNSVLSFGELLLRLSPRLGGEWIKNNTMSVFVGGSELNMAIALSHFNVPVSYCSAIPPHHLSEEIIEWLKEKRINTDTVHYSGNRIGTYYLPQGIDLKGAGVIYDRAHSSFWDLKPGEIDWDKVLNGINWFHFTAITPALNPHVAAVCREGAEAAAKKGITVSVDLNYRAKLWKYGKSPREVMPELVQYCDVVMGNIWAAEQMLGTYLPAEIKDDKQAYLELSQRSSEEIMKKFPRCRQVANTFRFDRRKGLKYYATLFSNNKLFISKEFFTEKVIDRVGSGDTFMAGLIYGNYNKLEPQEIIDFAAAAAFNKLFIIGDASTAGVGEIKQRMQAHE
jgi:2-dehydro-3-deoxygluconokinase